MTAPQIKSLLTLAPFRPFTLRLDGVEMLVEHPELVFVSPEETLLFVFEPGGSGAFNILEIAQLSFVIMPARKKSKAA